MLCFIVCLLFHSAGVGRTGSFIAIDAMMQRLKEKDDLDIYDFVTQMRTKRTYMVQNLVGRQTVLMSLGLLGWAWASPTLMHFHFISSSSSSLSYIDMSYGLPYISISSYENGHCLRTIFKYSLQKTSRDMAVDWRKNNVQVLLYSVLTRTTLRRSASNIATLESLFGSFFYELLLLKGWYKMQPITIRDYIKSSRKCPPGVSTPFPLLQRLPYFLLFTTMPILEVLE